MTERLATLQQVRDWLAVAPTSTASDSQLTRLIDAASQFVLGWLNRDSFRATVYTQNFRGNGKCTTLLRNWPIISVTSVGVLGSLIPASTFGTGGMPTNGYSISDPRDAPQSIDLYGYSFYYQAPSQVIYEAGFKTSQSTKVPGVVSPATYAVIAPQTGGCWSEDHGVTLDGVTATLNVDGTPAAGEYSVDEWGTYSFNIADVGKVAVITYDYTPWVINQAVVELIGEWWTRRSRIGVLSKSLGGQETVTFSQKDMNDSIRGALQIYKNEIPV